VLYDTDYSSRVIELIHAAKVTTEYTHEIIRPVEFTSIPSNVSSQSEAINANKCNSK